MKQSKMKTIAAVTVAAMLLGGCGDAPYELTETEENIIINYSAHVVSKFNTDQKQGLTYVNTDALDKEEEEEEVLDSESEETQETVADDTVTLLPDGAESGASETQAAELSDIFGSGAVEVTYTGATLTPNYVENTYYSVDAETGKTYLVLGFEIANTGTENITFDNLTRTPVFQAVLEDGTKAVAELTVLLEDFSTYEGTIPAGVSQDTVLLFQIPDTYTEVPDFTLRVTMGGTSYQIAL